MANIGFIGLGHMGTPMATNLLKANHSLYVYDLSSSAMQNLAAKGAKLANSIEELTANSEIVFTMLQTGEQVKEVCLGEKGIFSHLSGQGLYIDMSSIDIATSRELHYIALEKQLAMLDAPVSGGVAGAQSASLTFMVGGNPTDFERSKPILVLLGKKIIYAGAAGNGQAAKICNNMILGISMIAASEGFLLAKELGLAPEKFYEIATNSSAQSWSISKYCPMPDVLADVPAANNYQPGFTAAMMLKDLRLSQEAALQTKVATPLGAEAMSLYDLFVRNGHENLDFSGIIKMLDGKI